MNLIVAGPRDWTDRATVFDELDKWPGVDVVSAGGAPGLDGWAVAWARDRGIKCRIFHADWDRYGRSAGVRRSAEMLDLADPDAMLIAFVPSGKPMTTGTAHTVRLAHARGLSTVVVSPDGRVPWVSPLPDACGAVWSDARVELVDVFGGPSL